MAKEYNDYEAMLADLKKLVQFPSATFENITEDAPYGKATDDALRFVLGLCDSFGFRTKYCGGKTGWAEIGEGDEMVGVLAHLDVVPAGEGWIHPAYDLTVDGDKVYGRGVCDDKGPAMNCIYAMKRIKEAGTPLKRRIRLIFGLAEEAGGWADMAYYKEHEELPAFGITPDGDYPAIFGEKGIMNFEFSMPLSESGILEAAAGTAPNVVPHKCRLLVKNEEGQPLEVLTEGTAAHASTPELGKNAIAMAAEWVGKAGGVSKFTDFFNEHIGFDYNGGKMGCGLMDEKSGKLTMNAGVLKAVDDQLVLTVDVRCPVTYSLADVLPAMEKAAAPYGISVKNTENKPPIYLDNHGPVIEALLDVYREKTGDKDAQAIVIGGGTYARAMKNIVAFGPMFPNRELTEHMANEYAYAEDLRINTDIYEEALAKLANL